MGADLIVFIAKGPEKFTKRNKERALKRALKIQEQAKKLVALLNKGSDATPEEDKEAEELYASELMSGFRNQKMIDRLSEAEDYLGPMATITVPAFLDEFIDWWRTCSGRDTAGRSDPDDRRKKIVVCGEMSWGDTPEGYGYTMLDKAYWFDFPQMLGIV